MQIIVSITRANLCIIALISMFEPAQAEQSRLPDCPAFRRIFKWNDCIGSAQLPSGEKYEGEFRADKPNGQGTSTKPDGAKYIGVWKDGQYHGRGELILANREKYVGDFQYGAFNGKGIYTWPYGHKYVGAFQNGNRNGMGTFTWADGHKYVGEYQNDVRQGKGTYTLPNGHRYVGDFRNAEFNGQGILYAANGKVLQRGEWKDDKFCGIEKCFTLSLLTPSERIKLEIIEIQALLEKGLITHAEGWRRNQKTYAKYNWLNSQTDKEFFAVAIEAGSRLDKGVISKEQYDVEIQRAITRKQIQQSQISATENAKAAMQRQLEQNQMNAEIIRQQNEEMIRQQNQAARRDSAIRALGIAGGLAQPTTVAPPVSNTLPLGVPQNYNINGKPITCTNMGAVTNCQ
jgi:hypothetical protein